MTKAQHISDEFGKYIKETECCYQTKDKTLGVSIGIEKLDEKIGYLRGGDIILVAARPAMGKTSFAVNCSYRIAKKFKNEAKQNNSEIKQILYFNFECNNKNMIQRFVSLTSEIPLHKLMCNAKNYEQFEKTTTSYNKINQLPVYLCNQISGISDIKDEIYTFANKNKLGLVVIDYLQLVSLYSDDKTDKVFKKFMQDIKSIAEKLDIPIIILSQLNRDIEQRQNKRPTLNDIRGGCDNIVPYADKVLFLYRESYYILDKEPKQYKKETKEHFEKRYIDWENYYQELENKCEIIIAKNSSGDCACVRCLFDRNTGKFTDLEED